MKKSEQGTRAEKPRDAVRDRVLCASFEAFREKGFHGVSTLEIATRAKVSKRELYALFADKQAIVVECIKWRTKQMQAPLALPRPKDTLALSATLTAFGTALITNVCDSSVLAVFRLAISEAERTPEIAHVLNSAGREASRKIFADLVKNAQEDGLLLASDPAEATEFFFSVLWGDLQIRLLMGLAKTPTKGEIAQRAKHASTRLLAVYSKPIFNPI